MADYLFNYNVFFFLFSELKNKIAIEKGEKIEPKKIEIDESKMEGEFQIVYFT